MPNLESNISRWVTFLLAPLVLLAASFIAIKAKTWFNYDLSPAATAGYLFGLIGGVAGIIYKWVHNRGLYELSKSTGLPEEQLNHIISTIEEKLPTAPSAPTSPAEGSPEAPGAPPAVPPAAPAA